jgi:hypothetical protein
VSANKPFCTKDGIEVTDNLTFDHYIEENPKASTGKDDRKLIKHNIYILTKERDTKLDPKVQAFFDKPVDLSNVSLI